MKKNLLTLFTLFSASILSAAFASNTVSSFEIEAPVPLDTPLSVVNVPAGVPEGTVVLTCSIDARGKPTTIRIVESTNSKLNTLARRLLSEWTYVPASIQGKQATVKVIVPIVFIGDS